MGLSDHHGRVSEILESIDLEKGCDKNMTGLQSFNEQEPKIENIECEEITFDEGKDTIITDLLRENIEHNLTRIDEDLVDILVDLGKTNSVLNTDINEGWNVSNVGDKSLNFRQRQKKIRLICFNDYSMSEKNSEANSSITENGSLK